MIFIYNQNEEQIDLIDSKPILTLELSKFNTLEFESNKKFQKGFRCVYVYDSKVYEFVITEVTYTRSEIKKFNYFCQDSIIELKTDFINDKRPNGNLSTHLKSVLENTRWSYEIRHGYEDNLSISSSYYHSIVLESLSDIFEKFSCEWRTEFSFVGSQITSRKIIIGDNGSKINSRLEFGKNIKSFTRKIIDDDIITAIYGFGKGRELLDEDGNPTGNYGRRIDLSSVNNGKLYLENLSALESYGYGPSNNKRHKFAVVTFDEIDDENILLNETKKLLEESSKLRAEYEVEIINKDIDANIGDSIACIDDFIGFRDYLRIVKVEISNDKKIYKLGSTIKTFTENNTVNIRKLENQIVKTDETIYNALVSANGKNTVFTGVIGPKATRINDLWYKPLPDNNWQMLTFDGMKWVLVFDTTRVSDTQKLIDENKKLIDEQMNLSESRYLESKEVTDNLSSSVKDIKDKSLEIETNIKSVNTKFISYDNSLKNKLDFSVFDQKTSEIANQFLSIDDSLSNKVEVKTYNNLSTKVDTLSGTVSSYKGQIDSTTKLVNSLKTTTEGNSTTLAKLKGDFDSLSVGGRNLLFDTQSLESWLNWSSGASVNNAETGKKIIWEAVKQNALIMDLTNELEVGQKYTISFKARGNLSRLQLYVLTNPTPNYSFATINNLLTDNYESYSFTFIHSVDRKSIKIFIGGTSSSIGEWLELKHESVKLEKGSIATDWTPAPEDVLMVSEYNTFKQTVEGNFTSIGKRIDSSNSVINSVKQTAESNESLIGKLNTDMNGKLSFTDFNSYKQLVEGNFTSIGSKISSTETKLNTIEQTANGNKESISKVISNPSTTISGWNQLATNQVVDSKIKTSKEVKDTRNDNQTPEWYWKNYPKQVVEEFKYNNKIGMTLSGVGNYGMLTTNVQWSDSSGGVIVQSLVNTLGTFTRKSNGSTSWTGWVQEADRIYVNTEITKTADGITQEISKVKTDVNQRVLSSTFNTYKATSDTNFRNIGITSLDVTKGTMVSQLNTSIENYSKISSTISQVENAIQVGGRNLIIESTAKQKSYLLDTTKHPTPVTTTANTATNKDLISVSANQKFTLSKNIANGEYFRIIFYDANKAFIKREVSNLKVKTIETPTNAVYMWISYPLGVEAKVEEGAYNTPYSLAPEDNQTVLAFNTFERDIKSTISKVMGYNHDGSQTISTLKQLATSFSSTITTLKNNQSSALSRLSQTESDITTLVKKDNIISEISTRAGDIFMYSTDGKKIEKLRLTPNGTIMDTAFIKSGHLDRAIINSTHIGVLDFTWAKGKTLNAQEVNVINLTGNSITVDTNLVNKLTANTALVDGLWAKFISANKITTDLIKSKLGQIGGFTITDKYLYSKTDTSTLWLGQGMFQIENGGKINVRMDGDGVDLYHNGQITGKFITNIWSDTGRKNINLSHYPGSTLTISKYIKDSNSHVPYIVFDEFNVQNTLAIPVSVRSNTEFRNSVYFRSTAHFSTGIVSNSGMNIQGWSIYADASYLYFKNNTTKEGRKLGRYGDFSAF